MHRSIELGQDCAVLLDREGSTDGRRAKSAVLLACCNTDTDGTRRAKIARACRDMSGPRSMDGAIADTVWIRKFDEV